MNRMHVALVLPCFNEGSVVITLLQQLESVLSTQTHTQFDVVLVDDCSLDNTLTQLQSFRFKAGHIHFHLLTLSFNLGHQGCIYQGLRYAEQLKPTHVIIMDADGEDDPAAIPLLLAQHNNDIVEVRRGRRSESLTFRVLNFFYRIAFRLITGKNLHYGNFCMLRQNIVSRLCFTSFIHLPAYLLKLKVNRTSVTYDRARRIDGKSKMGYKNLLLHAFKSFVEFGDDLLLWFLRLFGIIILVLLLVGGNLLYQKFITHTAIPGWFSTLSMGLINLSVLCIGFFVLGILLINLMHQQNKGNQPIYRVISKNHE